MFATLAGFFAKSALMSSPLGGFLKMVPVWAWKALAIALALLGLYLLHQHMVHSFRIKVTNEVNASWQKRLDKERADALAWKHKYDQSQAAMAQAIRNRHEETLRSNAALADNLRVRGPGAARCGQSAYPSSAASTGGHVARPGQAGAAVASVPDQERVDLIGLPFAGTINAGQQCDGNLSEVSSWREWYNKLKATWPRG